MGRKKTAVQKAPRSKWHEHTAEKDIRYREPLNYQHFQILGWLCIVVSQVGLILSIGERLGKLPESFAGLTQPVTFLSFLSLPFLLIANFAQIMNGQKSYRFLLLKNFGAAAAVFAFYAFVLHRYLLGTIDMVNDGTVPSMDVLGEARRHHRMGVKLTTASGGNFVSFTLNRKGAGSAVRSRDY